MERNYKIFLLVLLGAFTAFAPLINNTLGPILGLVAKHFDSTQAVVISSWPFEINISEINSFVSPPV